METKMETIMKDEVVEELDHMDLAIIEYKMSLTSNTEIAKLLKKDRHTIENRLNKPIVQYAIKELKKEALQVLLDTQSKAALELRRILWEGTDENKIKAAKEVLKGVLFEGVRTIDDTEYEAIQEKLKKLREDAKE